MICMKVLDVCPDVCMYISRFLCMYVYRCVCLYVCVSACLKATLPACIQIEESCNRLPGDSFFTLLCIMIIISIVMTVIIMCSIILGMMAVHLIIILVFSVRAVALM